MAADINVGRYTAQAAGAQIKARPGRHVINVETQRIAVRIHRRGREVIGLSHRHLRRRCAADHRRLVRWCQYIDAERRQACTRCAVGSANDDIAVGAHVRGGRRATHKTATGAKACPGRQAADRKTQRIAVRIHGRGREVIGLSRRHLRRRCTADHRRLVRWCQYIDAERRQACARRAVGHANADIAVGAEIAVSKLADGTPGQFIRTDAAGTGVEYADDIFTINFVIDGGGTTITTGIKGTITVDFNCEVLEWAVTADQSGDIVVDVNRSTFAGYPTTLSIAGTELPTITTSTKGEDRTITTWSTINTGDVLEFEVDSITTIQRATVSIVCRKTG